jgi:hypothetical protein
MEMGESGFTKLPSGRDQDVLLLLLLLLLLPFELRYHPHSSAVPHTIRASGLSFIMAPNKPNRPLYDSRVTG